MASEAAKWGHDEDTAISLATALSEANSKVLSSGVGAMALDTPRTASAFLLVGNTYRQLTTTARTKIAAWKSRMARGLIVNGFGAEASSLLQ